MGWNDTWDDILQGGAKRWKVDDLEKKAIALNHIRQNADAIGLSQTTLEIFCPLAGDDPFVYHAWSQGHSVTAADLVPAALGEIRKQFQEGSWEKEECPNTSSTVWKHDSGRATLYETDILKNIPELENAFDIIYDKDSFGALDIDTRKPFCERMAKYIKKGGLVYTEVKLKDDDNPAKHGGPPFHVTKEVLMEPSSFGSMFEYLESLGKVYDIAMPEMMQTAHILRRLSK